MTPGNGDAPTNRRGWSGSPPLSSSLIYRELESALIAASSTFVGLLFDLHSEGCAG